MYSAPSKSGGSEPFVSGNIARQLEKALTASQQKCTELEELIVIATADNKRLEQDGKILDWLERSTLSQWETFLQDYPRSEIRTAIISAMKGETK
jgi:hypothetical protein